MAGKYSRRLAIKRAVSRAVLDQQRQLDGTARKLQEQMPLDGDRPMTDELELSGSGMPVGDRSAVPKGWTQNQLATKSNQGHTHGFGDLPDSVEHTGHEHNWASINNKPNFLSSSDLNGYATQAWVRQNFQGK